MTTVAEEYSSQTSTERGRIEGRRVFIVTDLGNTLTNVDLQDALNAIDTTTPTKYVPRLDDQWNIEIGRVVGGNVIALNEVFDAISLYCAERSVERIGDDAFRVTCLYTEYGSQYFKSTLEIMFNTQQTTVATLPQGCEYDAGTGDRGIVTRPEGAPYEFETETDNVVIGLDRNTVKGAPIIVPNTAFRFNVWTLRFSADDYEAIQNRIGTINNGTITINWAQGSSIETATFTDSELLLTGASTSPIQKEGPIKISYEFLYSDTVEIERNIGGAETINKYGWDYFWARTKDSINGTTTKGTVPGIYSMHTAQVYRRTSFSDLPGIGSGGGGS